MASTLTNGAGEYILTETATVTTTLTSQQDLYTFNIPAGILVNAGDSLLIDFFMSGTGSGAKSTRFYVVATSAVVVNNSSAGVGMGSIIVTRKDSSTMYMCVTGSLLNPGAQTTVVSGTDSAAGFAIKFTGTAAAGSTISMTGCSIQSLKPSSMNSAGMFGAANSTNVQRTNTAGAYQDLHSYTIPANALISDGDYIDIFSHNTFTGTGQVVTMRLQVAGTDILMTRSNLSASAFRAFTSARIIRINSSTLCVRGFYNDTNFSNQGYSQVITGLTVTNSMTVKFTAAVATTATLTQNLSWYALTRT